MLISFIVFFVECLGWLCVLCVVEVVQFMLLEVGMVYVCKGGVDSIFIMCNGCFMLVSCLFDVSQLWYFLVQLLGVSVLQLYLFQVIVGVMFIGMSSDGVEVYIEIW